MTPRDPIAHLETIFAEHANRVFAIEYPLNRQVTYGEFRAHCLRTARMLRARKIGAGDRVAVLLANSLEYAALYFACMFIGAVAVPVNQALHAREVRAILEAARPRVILFSLCTRPLVLSAASGLGVPLLRIALAQEKAAHPDADDETWAFDSPDDPSAPEVEPFADVKATDPFLVLYTSGTASAPKGVAHTIASEVGNALFFNAEMSFGPSDRFLNIWPMAYSTGVLNTLLSPFAAGGSVVIAPTFGPKSLLTFWKPIVQFGVNTLWLSPTMLAALLRVDRDSEGGAYARTGLRTVCVGTAPLPAPLKRDFEVRYGVELFESYGLSELLLIAANSRRQPRSEGSVGRLLSGAEVVIEADGRQVVDAGVEGEILVRTPFAMLGYLDETGAPSALDREAFFPTGDIGRFDAAGNLFITGRKKDLIIRGGLNISPRAVEDVLLDHPSITEAVVVGLPHEFLGEEVAALVTLKPGRKLADERSGILTWCRERLNGQAIPTRLHGTAALPRGSTGKILRREARTLVERLAPDADEV